jgi:hypothetical protein
MKTNWRGEWLTLYDLAHLLGKSYAMVYKMHRQGTVVCSGVRFVREGYRIWAKVDESAYQSLIR